VNLVDQVLEVYREPVLDAPAPYGWSYRSIVTLTRLAFVELLGVSGARVAVVDLLP
jgi:hypothetical protein